MKVHMAGGITTRVFERRELVDEMTVALKAQKEVRNKGEKWYEMKCTPCVGRGRGVLSHTSRFGRGGQRKVSEYKNSVGVTEVIAGNQMYKVAQHM